MNDTNICAKCKCTLIEPSASICKNRHRLCEQCHAVYFHIERFACPACGGPASLTDKQAELGTLDGGYQESTINMDQESRNSMEVSNRKRFGQAEPSAAVVGIPQQAAHSCTPVGCVVGMLLGVLVWASTVLNCLYYFSRTNLVGEEVAVLLLFLMLCQYYQYGYAQISQLESSPFLRAKALLKHLFFFPFVIQGQYTHISKMFALKELVLALAVIIIEASNQFVWEKLAILALTFNLVQFIAVLLFTFRPLNPIVEGMTDLLVRKSLLRRLIAGIVGLGNHVFLFMCLIVSYWLYGGLFALNLLYLIYLFVALVIHHCRNGTMTGWFVLRLPYLYVDAVMNKLLCQPYIRAVFFLCRYALTPVLFGYVSYDILMNWDTYITSFGCTSEATCPGGVAVLNAIIAGFAMSLFSLLEIPVGCMLICPN